MITAILLQVTNTATTVVDSANRVAQNLPVVAAPPASTSISVWDMVLKGGPLMWPLGLMTESEMVNDFLFILKQPIIHKRNHFWLNLC